MEACSFLKKKTWHSNFDRICQNFEIPYFKYNIQNRDFLKYDIFICFAKFTCWEVLMSTCGLDFHGNPWLFILSSAIHRSTIFLGRPSLVSHIKWWVCLWWAILCRVRTSPYVMQGAGTTAPVDTPPYPIAHAHRQGCLYSRTVGPWAKSVLFI